MNASRLNRATQSEINQAEQQVLDAANRVDWVYHLKWMHSRDPRITGLGYLDGQLVSLDIQTDVGQPTVSFEAIPVTLADAMTRFAELQVTERISWCDNEHGAAFDQFLREVAAALDAAEATNRAIAA